MKNRAIRRHHSKRVKAKVKKHFSSWSQSEDEKWVGKAASVHGAFCSCHMCGNPRKFYKGKDALTMQERKQNTKEE